ncbi:hypothetical protein CGRA01v4_01553 [Colletotrichum graminicola]|nr:hypothetical protein CGRA01v4_01553 [Colletotrichum graminicola]
MEQIDNVTHWRAADCYHHRSPPPRSPICCEAPAGGGGVGKIAPSQISQRRLVPVLSIPFGAWMM